MILYYSKMYFFTKILPQIPTIRRILHCLTLRDMYKNMGIHGGLSPWGWEQIYMQMDFLLEIRLILYYFYAAAGQFLS
ncbi:hypothetical protein CE91St36_22780 [Christensenellaceae bacterium]|nr:hypothetical protein CE91St36_22780 [Christensenellaceae bacterium]BDF62126.1 hypothetical protein CE91St37_22760 [Christensenellaceae bacterium]